MHARHLPFFHSQKISARQSRKWKALCWWKNQKTQKRSQCPTGRCICLSITGTPEQGLGSWPVPGKSKPAAQPNTGEIYSHAASPACLAHRGLATLGSIWFSLWHKWAKHSCGCLKSETGFSTLGLESGANLWEVTFKETIAIMFKKLTSLLTNSKLLTWGRLMPSLVSRGFNCEGGLSHGCDERPQVHL